MAKDLNSVKTPTSADRAYHHGALRQALLEAAESLIAARGGAGFSLREPARRAGVSPAAPAHHFGDARGLLTAVAAEAFRRFGDALAAADDGSDREARIRAKGVAYVRFAIAAPAMFDLMWRYALVDREDPDYVRAGARAYRIIDVAVRGEAPVGEPVHGKAPSTIAAWSMVHGFARLALDGAFGDDSGAAAEVADRLLPDVLAHLEV